MNIVLSVIFLANAAFVVFLLTGIAVAGAPISEATRYSLLLFGPIVISLVLGGIFFQWISGAGQTAHFWAWVLLGISTILLIAFSSLLK